MLAQLLVAGLSSGSIYALIAFGFVAIFNVVNTISFPQGMYLMLGAFLALTFISLGLPLPVAVLLAVIATIGIVLALSKLTILNSRHKDFISSVLIMCGLGFLYEGIMVVTWGRYPHQFPTFSQTLGLEIGGVFIATQSIWVIGTTVAIGILMWYFFGRQLYGKAMRATAQNPFAAKLVGINTNTMMMLSVALSAALGAIAGIVMAPLTYVVYGVGWEFTMRGFVAAVIGGGLSSYAGAFVGGIVVGIIETLTIGYITSLFKDVVLFAILIIILVLRPHGILGKRQV